MMQRDWGPWVMTTGATMLALATAVGGCGLLIGIEPLSGEELPGDSGLGGSNGAGTGSASNGSGSQGVGAGLPCSECVLTEWTRGLNGGGEQLVDDLAIGKSGKIAFAGTLAGSADLEGQCLPNEPCPLTSGGANDAIVGMFASDGKPLWSLRFGDMAEQSATGIAIDSSDGVTVVGSFRGAINAGGGTLSSANLNTYDVFIARFDAAGNHLASQQHGDGNNQNAQDIVVAPLGDLIIGGHFLGNMTFGCNPPLSAPNSFQIFIARLSPTLECLWNKQFGTESASVLNAVTMDSLGNIAITGKLQGTVDFGDGPKMSLGPDDIFVAKLTSAGDPVWSKLFGGAGIQEGRDIAVDAEDNVYVTGSFEGTLDFGNGYVLDSAGAKDVFVVKLEKATGTALWARSFGGSGDQIGESIATAPNGHVFVTGSMAESASFAGKPLTSAGSTDMFVLHYDADGNPQCGSAFGDALAQGGRGLAVDAQGGLILGANYNGELNLGCATSTSKGGTDVMIMRMSL